MIAKTCPISGELNRTYTHKDVKKEEEVVFLKDTLGEEVQRQSADACKSFC